MSTRRERALRRQGWVRAANRRKGLVPRCPECGQAGPHFVPPCFGDIGFFSCNPPADIVNHSRDSIQEI